ncbi:Clp1/GlmU family protein [Saccharolobus solfataricus]|uniref:polynucleotide 5'-hydroxyl-kinase n=1 Tax=Saccharolobus solfataricus TaxID=2287 RepID=A0A3G8ERB0_SACSO|nr:Clp1/GlmU family protein [Saccharolobus solfataricus]AZF84231.1 GTPase [Saccharolobus solfataricus]
MKKEQIIQGPCTIKVLEGEARIIGIDIRKNDSLTIPSNKTYTIVYDNNTKLEMNCKKLLNNVNLGWDQIVQEIVDTGGVVVLLGNTDSGKTYLANLFTNLATSYLKIIDADVGQSTLFLPTFIAELKPMRKTLNLEELGYDSLEFFGDITPSTNPRLHVQKIVRLYETTPKEKLTVIDTDGWTNGLNSMLHKFELLYTIDPDYIIVFDQKIKDYLPENYRNRAILLKSINLRKSRSERRANRITKYERYFNEANNVKIPSENVLGKPISDILYYAWGEYIQLSDKEPCVGHYISLNLLKGALLGIIENKKVVGAALLVNLKENEITILSRVNKFTGLVLGYISLNDKFQERRIRFRKCKS